MSENRWKNACARGAGLPRADILEALRRVTAKPDDLEGRLLLIGANETRAAHILWLIAHHPDVDIGLYGLIAADTESYSEGRRLWLAAVRESPADPAIAAAASFYLTLSEPQEAERILLAGRKVDASNAQWSRHLASLYENQMMRALVWNNMAERSRLGALALASYLDAFAAESSAPDRLDLIWPMRQCASAIPNRDATEQLQAADNEARLSRAYPHGQPEHEHFSRMACGLVALVQDRLDEAERELLAAPLATMKVMPSMALAAALLHRGRTPSVLSYLQACEHSVSAMAKVVTKWMEAIRRGEAPDMRTPEGSSPP